MMQHTGNKNELWFRHHMSGAQLTSKGYAIKSLAHIPRSMIDEGGLSELLPHDQIGDLRLHLGLQEPREGQSSSSSSVVPLPSATADGGAAGQARVQVRRRQSEEGYTRTVRQRVEVIEAVSRKRLLDSGGTPPRHVSEATRRRTAEPPISQEAPGDPAPWLREPDWMPVWLHREALRARRQAMDDAATGRHETADHEETMAAGAMAAAAPTGPSEAGHHLMNAGPLLFCNRCGAYGLGRAGSRLMGVCNRAVSRDVRVRLDRMRQGLHPLTGMSIT